MLARAMARLNNAVNAVTAGIRSMEQLQLVAIDGDNQTLTVAAIIAGIINRTGTTANTADVFPSADTLVAALPDLSVGDSFNFSIRMANAHTNTLTLGTGISSVGTVGIVASNIREYMLTLLSGPNPTVVTTGTTTNANKVLTNIPAAVLATLSVGMGVTGTGIGASNYVTAVNLTAGTVSVAVDSTATADDITLTFTPRFSLTGLRTSAI